MTVQVKPIVAAFLGAASLCATLAVYISSNHIEIATALTDWFIHRHSFTVFFYTAIAFMGAIFLSAGQRGSLISEFVAKAGQTVANFYASAAGTVIGWALGLCYAASSADPGRYLLISIFLLVMLFATLSAPLAGMVITRNAVETFNNRLFRDEWREKFIRLMGWLMIVLAIIGLVHDW